jgi:integrase/recombinase XerC
MAKVKRVKYFTPEKEMLINSKNLELYEKYCKSNILKNKEVEDTTFKTYRNYMKHFLIYLAEEWDNVGLYDKEFFDNAIDIIEGFMAFCQDVLENHGKVINTKVSAISSFYGWSVKRKIIDFHPFDGKIERMKGANDIRITKDYFLTEEQIDQIAKELKTNPTYDIQDRILFHLAIDSANRVGAISKLTLSSMDLDNMMFTDIREKRGKRVEVTFDEVCRDYIEEWLEMRKDIDNLEIDSLFLTRYHGMWKQMTYGTIQDRATKIGKIVGIDDFHMHCFRKSSINMAMKLSGDIEIAKELANHKSTDTTLLYIKPKSKTEIRNKLKELKEKKKNESKQSENNEE